MFFKLFCFLVENIQYRTNFKHIISPNNGHVFQQSIFRKFKKMFYVFYKSARSKTNKPTFVMFTVITIFLPCLIILLLVLPSQLRSEVKIRNTTVLINKCHKIVSPGIVIELNEGAVKDLPKFIAFIVELFNSRLFQRTLITR